MCALPKNTHTRKGAMLTIAVFATAKPFGAPFIIMHPRLKDFNVNKSPVMEKMALTVTGHSNSIFEKMKVVCSRFKRFVRVTAIRVACFAVSVVRSVCVPMGSGGKVLMNPPTTRTTSKTAKMVGPGFPSHG